MLKPISFTSLSVLESPSCVGGRLNGSCRSEIIRVCCGSGCRVRQGRDADFLRICARPTELVKGEAILGLELDLS